MVKISKMTQPARSLLLLSWIVSVVATSTGNELGAVASESKVCSQVGIELLRRGVSSVERWVSSASKC